MVILFMISIIVEILSLVVVLVYVPMVSFLGSPMIQALMSGPGPVRDLVALQMVFVLQENSGVVMAHFQALNTVMMVKLNDQVVKP